MFNIFQRCLLKTVSSCYSSETCKICHKSNKSPTSHVLLTVITLKDITLFLFMQHKLYSDPSVLQGYRQWISCSVRGAARDPTMHTLTYDFTRHEEEIKHRCNNQPLHNPLVFHLLPLLGAVLARVHVQPWAAHAGGGLQQGVVVVAHHQGVDGHPIGRSSGRVIGHLAGDHHFEFVELGRIVLHQVVGEVEGSCVAQVPVALLPPEGGAYLTEEVPS